MGYTQNCCAKCGGELIRRNGSNNGQPKYRCLACRYQALFVPAAVRKAAHSTPRWTPCWWSGIRNAASSAPRAWRG